MQTNTKDLKMIDVQISDLLNSWRKVEPYRHEGTDFFVMRLAGASSVEFWLMRNGKRTPVLEYDEPSERKGFCDISDLLN